MTDKETLINQYSEAYETGNVELLKIVLNSKEFATHFDVKNSLEFVFDRACEGGHLNMVKFLLTESDFKKIPKLQYYLNEHFCEAVAYNHLHIVKYLSSSKELKVHAQINYQDNQALIKACENGNLDIVKYLLTSPELKNHADIHTQNDKPFSLACSYNHLHIVEWLLTEFQEPIDIYNNDGFKFACLQKSDKVIDYLLFEKNIQITKEMYNWLGGDNEYNDTESYLPILNLIKNRELNITLHDKLSSPTENKKKLKI